MLEEIRCKEAENFDLRSEASKSKQGAIETQSQLKELIALRLKLQEDIHLQGKDFAEKSDCLENKTLATSGENQALLKSIVTLE